MVGKIKNLPSDLLSLRPSVFSVYLVCRKKQGGEIYGGKRKGKKTERN